MGYTTDFEGFFQLDKPLTPEHAKYLAKFSNTRRVKRDASMLEGVPDPIREAAGLPLGVDGEFFVGAEGMAGQDHSSTHIVEYNSPPGTQPGLWCQWLPSNSENYWNGCPDPDDESADWTGLDAIAWDGGEKFYNYVEWIDYIIDNLLRPWGYVVNGSVSWYGEDRDDIGLIVVEDNELEAFVGVDSLEEIAKEEKSTNYKRESLRMLQIFTKYLNDVEVGSDFYENIHDQKWKIKGEREIEKAKDEIGYAIDFKQPRDILETINKYIENPNHVYVDVLKAQILIANESGSILVDLVVMESDTH